MAKEDDDDVKLPEKKLFFIAAAFIPYRFMHEERRA
jgi:hypothetical protein